MGGGIETKGEGLDNEETRVTDGDGRGGKDELYGSGLVDCYSTEVAPIREVGRQGGLGSFRTGMLGVGNSTDYAPQRIGLYASKSFKELSLDWQS